MRYWSIFTAAFMLFVTSTLGRAESQEEAWTPDIAPPLVGPYIVDPATLAEPDQPGSGCATAGPLNFQCLAYRDDRATMAAAQLSANPFTIPVFDKVIETADVTYELWPGVAAPGFELHHA